MKATCDECNLEFDVVFKTVKKARGIHETYFRCDKCFVHTTCFITNGKVRRLQREIKQEGSASKREAMQAEINATMDELKVKYGRR